MEKRECELGYFEWEKPSLIKFTLTKGEPSIEGIDEYTKLSEEIFEELGEQFVMVFDATQGKWLSAEGRIKWGKDSKMMEDKYGHRNVKNYMVIPNSIIKMMLKGVNLISKPRIPQVIFDNVEDAMKAAEKEVSAW